MNEYVDMDEVIANSIRENDPNEPFISIYNMDSDLVQLYGKALQGNTVVDHLVIDMYEATNTIDGDSITVEHLQSLLDFIVDSKSLETIELVDIQDTLVVGYVLQATAQSSSVRTVKLKYSLVTRSSLEYLVRTTRSVTDLAISMVSIVVEEEDESITDEQLAYAFRNNISISNLSLRGLDDSFLIPLFENLGSNNNIRTLMVGASISDESMSVPLATALQHYLLQTSNNNSIQSIEFVDFTFAFASFAPIYVGITGNSSLTEIDVIDCIFCPRSTALFQSLFLTTHNNNNNNDASKHTNITALRIGMKTQFSVPMSTFLSEILSLKPARCKLKDISFFHFDYASVSDDMNFETLLQPLMQGATLHSLRLGLLYMSERLEELIDSIPKLTGLKELEFGLLGDIETMPNVRRILKAMEENTCLEKVSIGTELLSKRELNWLDFYGARNKFIRPFVLSAAKTETTTDEASVPLSYWPFIFQAAQEYQCQRDVIFIALNTLNDSILKNSIHN